MRKIDKKLNLQKVNILTEQRYLQSKGLLKEEMELKIGDEIVWIAPPKEIDRLLRVMTGAKGEYIGRKTSGEYVVKFGSRRFYANDFQFELSKKEGSNDFNSNKRIDEMDYERKVTMDDFKWINKFTGWYVTELSNGVVSIKNDDYPIISFEVSAADYNNGGHQTYGKPTNQEYPWKFTIKKAVNPDSFINKNFAPEGFTIINGGQTSDIESSFTHFLKHELPYLKKGEKINLQNS